MNVLIVESKNDKDFVTALLKVVNASNTEVGVPVCGIDDYECLGGLNLNRLSLALESKISQVTKGNIRKIGVLIDQDQDSMAERLAFVSTAASEAFQQEVKLNNINELVTIQLDEYTSFELICHFTNIEGAGELETLLRKIKSAPSPHADCLDTWRTCLPKELQSRLTDKEFGKMWIDNYLRLDTCSSSKFRGNKGKYCSMKNLDKVLERKTPIFDLNANEPELQALRAFLQLFDISSN